MKRGDRPGRRDLFAGGLGLAAALTVLGAAAAAAPPARSAPSGAAPPLQARCEALGAAMTGRWPEAGARLESATARASDPTLPEHCEVIGVLHERQGVGGQAYAIRFHVRLPAAWNGRFFFQGGGGTDGDLGDALGHISSGSPVALAQGYAVVSQDSGHDNARNTDPARGGAAAFGFDPQARADYGGASLKVVADAAKALVRVFYGRGPERSYFVGCSKGGQEGMMLAQRYSDEFDGVIAGAPGFSLPRAALAEAWDTQSFAAASDKPAASIAELATTFSAADTQLVQKAVLAACDGDDGAVDGMVAAFTRCTTARVRPKLAAVTCANAKTDACLSPKQVAALLRANEGPHDGTGRPLYANWAWDAGVGSPGWRLWKIGLPGQAPALNVVLGAGALASIFTTPPTPLAGDPKTLMDYARAFDFDGGAQRIYASGREFPRSAWRDIGARSPDLDAFRSHGGKMIVYHGVSDPVFSVLDTLAWYDAAVARTGGKAAAGLRVYPVPGMAHCGGGPATDGFDLFPLLVRWVEQGQAPETVIAKAGRDAPWPGRTRPLCPYPQIARYRGRGSLEDASSFSCVADRHVDASSVAPPV